MTQEMPRIAAVTAETDTALRVTWKSGGDDVVELAGWVARASPVLAPLRDAALFRQPQVVAYGAGVAWGDPDGDLGIDALHLSLLAAEQRPFGAEDIAAWQAEAKISNQEAADFLGLSLSAWNGYKAGASIPQTVRMACRAALRDPVLFSAYLRPRKAGRPRKATSPPL